MQLPNESTNAEEWLDDQNPTDDCYASNHIANTSINRRYEKRGTVEVFSDISKNRLKKAILEFPNITHTIVVTYGNYAPITSKDARSECIRLRKLLTKFHISGIWKVEFQDRAAFHIHLAVSMSPSIRNKIPEIEKHFFRYTNSFSKGMFRVRDMYNIDGLMTYFLKDPGVIPAGWHGRFWAEFGEKDSHLSEPIETDDQGQKRRWVVVPRPPSSPEEEEEEEEEIDLRCEVDEESCHGDKKSCQCRAWKINQ